ncbi:alpha/beta fold hydrolase [Streptomyces sp. 4N509B]|uniref:alpha/beta fold hydrolase n=1 Tax=Streptomyces sp. 4N509B TaxID=3457413 RepID=UPI003FD47DE2
MNRTKILKTPAAIALCCAVAGVGLAGCDEPEADAGSGSPTPTPTREADEELLTGTATITVGGHSVRVSCSGSPAGDRPVVVLLHGGGHDLSTMADLQRTLSADGRVCSYDRLGAGESDQPPGRQDYDAVGETLTGVLDQLVGDAPVVLAGHSMGGLIAARYAPDHQDRVRGLVLMDATSPTAVADLTSRIPESATGTAGDLRAETLAVYGGENPERLVFTDGEVRSAGDIPAEVIRHGREYFPDIVPEYGQGLEEDWAAGQEKWLAISTNSEPSTAENSGHDIYLDEPEVAVAAVERVVTGAAGG